MILEKETYILNFFTYIADHSQDDDSDDLTNDMTNSLLPDDDQLKKPGRKRKPKDDTEQPIYPCEDCTQCFTTQADLKVHARTHPKDSRHICKICNQGFASASTLCRHMKVTLLYYLNFYHLMLF